jgi:hypothetical protein
MNGFVETDADDTWRNGTINFEPLQWGILP